MSGRILGVDLLQLARRNWWGGSAPAGPSFSVVGVSHVETYWWHDEQGTAWDWLIPADTEEGDIIMAFFGGRDGATFTTPGTYGSAWFNLATGGNVRSTGFYRYATAAEGGTTEHWDTSSQDRQQIGMLVVVRGGVASGDPLDVAIVNSTANNNTPGITAITTISDDCFLVNWVAKRWNGDSTYVEDSGAPAVYTAHHSRYLNPSYGALATYQAGAAGLVAADTWSALPAGETNAWYSVTIALKAA